MARMSDEQIEQLKQTITIERVCSAYGIELHEHGLNDLAGLCPFHEEDEPSFIVTPAKGLYHCMGCARGGSVIDLVMELEKIGFREAVEKLLSMTGHSIESLEGQAGQGTARKQPDKPAIPPERAAALLERALAVYERNFAESGEARAYLESRGITDAALFTAHRIGYSNGKLSEMLPGNGNVRKDLNGVGILLDPKPETAPPERERFSDCVVFPVFDEEGLLTTIYGRSISGKGRHLFLPGRSTGLWNAQSIKTHSEIILTESVIDALSVMVAGFANVIAIQGTNGVKDADIETLRRHGVSSVVLLLDGDDAGGRATGKLRPRLESRRACRDRQGPASRA